jgi:hypothetical protein
MTITKRIRTCKNHEPKIQVKLGNSSAGKSKKTRPGIVSEDNWQAKYAKYYLTCSI